MNIEGEVSTDMSISVRIMYYLSTKWSAHVPNKIDDREWSELDEGKMDTTETIGRGGEW